MIEFREPPQTGFELRWSLFGIRFRVLPSFFLFSALLSAFFVWQMVGNNPVDLAVGIVIDVACIAFAFLFTELVQGLVYRSYGLRSAVVLRELGGGIYPEHEPPMTIQRIVVALASPASSFLLFALVHYSNEEYRWAAAHQWAGFAYLILWIITLFWGIIGLLPIFPYPGGRILLEVLNFVSPRNGLVLTLVVSVIVGIAYIGYTVAVLYFRQPQIPLPGGVSLPANVLLAVFIALATMQNWQFLQHARTMRRGYQEPVDEYDDDRRPWER